MMILILMLAVPLAYSKPHVAPNPNLQRDIVQLTETEPKITYLPYYGGAKGQTLKLTELSNGSVNMEIIKTTPETETSTEIQPSELEMPQLPQRPISEFANNLRNIHKTALNIIRIQEEAKKRGEIDDDDEAEYRENLESLHLSAGKLAEMQNDDDEEFNFNENTDLNQWLARKKSTKKDTNKKKEEEKKKKEEEEKRKEEEEEQKRKEENKRKEEEKEIEETTVGKDEDVGNESPEDTAVAEAKPVGLAIAGFGGIAASKPIATAVVGPGGLAVARPVGTAIAGVSPDQELVPIYAESDSSSYSKKDMSKEQKKKLSNTEYLNKIIQRYHQRSLRLWRRYSLAVVTTILISAMLPKYFVLVLSVLVTIVHGAAKQRRNENSRDEIPKRYSLPLGPPVQYNPNQYPVGVDPQYQFNYVPNKQYYPNNQPPFILYGGAGVPGQQFLYRPGSPPPGNFLIPQPGPDVMYGNPQTPVFTAGYPKPAHIPPIEKDAEEVPNLAGNHRPTRTGRPNYQSKLPVRPQRIETFDEVESGEEVDDFEQAEKNPNNFYPKKAFPNRPVLKPGQQFFILNGNTLFSNVPLEEEPIPQQQFGRSAPRITSARTGKQRQSDTAKQSSKKAPAKTVQKESENHVSLNNAADFKEDDGFLREPIEAVQQVPLILPHPHHPHLPLSPYLLPNPIEEQLQYARNFHFNPGLAPYNPYYEPAPYPYVVTYDPDEKEDDDTVTIDAKSESEEEKKVEESTTVSTTDEPSISQSKPSALAVSGVGGVASAGPKGTALVGNKGLAVASPEATAVAGPTKDESDQKSKTKKE
ncbi:hypothetical protein RN001_007370 [Aquatica leii]|uniref:DUF4774 domain-containing protein n=1 Tax=Aquatica leii TaxID=1421715 RepID=A0AAN7SGS9_9COLE|nr:hypothetical protein RN001_007370 [Aquatica leii]